MWNQSPEDPLQLTPIQQLQWFELLVREEAIRLLQDSQDYCEIELPFRNVPKDWNQVLARLPQRLATFTKYFETDLHKRRPSEPEGYLTIHCDVHGRDAVEAIIRKFMKEADAELFPVPSKSAPAKRKPTLSEADQKLYRDLGHENIATSTNKELWKANLFRLGLRSAGWDAFRSQLHRIRTSLRLPLSESLSRPKKKSAQP
jgi:hypothetical protein